MFVWRFHSVLIEVSSCSSCAPLPLSVSFLVIFHQQTLLSMSILPLHWFRQLIGLLESDKFFLTTDENACLLVIGWSRRTELSLQMLYAELSSNAMPCVACCSLCVMMFQTLSFCHMSPGEVVFFYYYCGFGRNVTFTLYITHLVYNQHIVSIDLQTAGLHKHPCDLRHLTLWPCSQPLVASLTF